MVRTPAFVIFFDNAKTKGAATYTAPTGMKIVFVEEDFAKVVKPAEE